MDDSSTNEAILASVQAELEASFETTCNENTAVLTIKSYTGVLKRACNFFREMKYDVFDDDNVSLKLSKIQFNHLAAFFAKHSVHQTGPKTGERKSKSSPESFRNAFVYYFNQEKIPMPGDIYELSKKFISAVGKKRKKAQNEGLAESNARCEVNMKENEVFFIYNSI